ncbi:hypothetical protein TSAR_001152 [Trichomalopsis sarcophagae]|uniref:Uncharacterized protein n=1 Tax=Trichomalopsis sarcophagae TaxID=543379 RepID=A0A232EV07_9HYME|nr:hypothetical protein TSAR_001152 [Trichomalopsis sarcophagae]
MIFKLHINSENRGENLTLHLQALKYDSIYVQHCVLTDFVLFKYNYCVKSVINALKVTNDAISGTLFALTQWIIINNVQSDTDSEGEDVSNDVPAEMLAAAKEIALNSLTNISKEKYTKVYNEF